MTDKTNKQPKPIYQYRPPAMWALDNLFRGVIYFRSPREFNDPYDCRTPPSLRALTDKQLAFLRGENPEVWGIHANNAAMPKGEFIAKVNKKLRQIHKSVVRECGVACFSKCGDNLLMWSHYAGGGRGFCLEFVAPVLASKVAEGDSVLPFEHDVEYGKKFPAAYGYVEALAQGLKIPQYTELLLAHKHKEWAYEREVRMFQGRVGEKGYPPEALKAIHIGTEATECTRALIRSITEAKYPHAAIKERKRQR